MKNLLIVGIVVIIAIAGFIYFVAPQSTMAPVSTTSVDSQELPVDVQTSENSDSRYVAYTKTALDGAAAGRRVLFFYANWCPTCLPVNEEILQNEAQIPSDVTIIRVNYNDTETDNEEKALAARYVVTYQHTFVQIDSTGEQVAIWNGGGLDELLTNIQ